MTEVPPPQQRFLTQHQLHFLYYIFAAVAIASAVFFFDIFMPLGIAGGVPYVALVLVGIWLPKNHHTFVLAAIGTVLVGAGYALSPLGGVEWVVLTNRGLAIFSIWIVAILVFWRKRLEIGEEYRYRRLYNRTPTMLHSIDPDGTVTHVSDFWLEHMGYSRDDVIGHNICEFMTPASATYARDVVLSHYFETGQSRNIPYQFVKRNGDIIDVEVSGSMDSSKGDGIVRSLAVMTDVTERIAAERKLRDNERHFRHIYHNTPVMLQSIDQKGALMNVSNYWLDHMGYDRDEVVGRSPVDFMTPKSREYALNVNHPQFFKSGFCRDIPYQFVKKNGDVIDTLLSAVAERDEGGKIIHSLSVISDISDLEAERKKSEAAVHEAEKASQAKSDFLASMSHELRTPMNAILGFTQLLSLNLTDPLTEAQKTHVEAILQAGNHLLELIEQVLELSKIEAGHMPLTFAHVSPVTIVRDCLPLIEARAEKAEIQIDNQITGDDCPDVWTDGTRLKQVLLNILSNAVKYNREGGRVTLSCRENKDDTLRICVGDTGHGIPEELYDNLFEPFERLGLESGKIEGSGIGLTITREITEKMGGKIGFESVEGTGTTFWVDLPTDEIRQPPVSVAE